MTNGTGGPALQVDRLGKTYGSGEQAVTALAGVSRAFERGTFTAIMGPSGSGKTTFLNCVSGLERATSGEVRYGGKPLPVGTERDVTVFRRRHIGFVFQGLNLLPYLTAHENVALPLRLSVGRANRKLCRELLEQVGLGAHADRYPAQLSGGQQQRVAIARALVTRPDVVFADEPTGALDSNSARQVLGVLRASVDRLGQTVVMVTHDPVAAAHADSVVFLADGRIVGTMVNPTADAVAARMTKLDEPLGDAVAVVASAGAR
jgi:putative ABC transport system ATP-binding protein